MGRQRVPHIHLIVKTEDGARLESKGQASEAKAFAVHIFNWLYEVEPKDPNDELMCALRQFKEICEKYRAKGKQETGK